MGPGASALRSSVPPTPNIGSTARDRTMIPMPPSQWVKLRQNKIPRGFPSMWVNTEAPVVEKPDMASKNASV
ncbi:MAG: hypothetical protein BWY88_01116 [Synergistetes bacterium ADurb.Bin520]|nr:MAG: hypothetical protein BWY88_01116 [Synergistetes bacterium ADurb.Bin520]